MTLCEEKGHDGSMFYFLVFALTVLAATPTPSKKVESYKDLISKARHLTLQRDRLQATQVLIRGIQRETRNTAAHKELVAAIDELSGAFYTEKAQSLFLLADGLEYEKPKESIEKLNEALRLEEGNVSILKALGRSHLRLGECSSASKHIFTARELNPYSAEIRLLNLQLADCEKNAEQLTALLSSKPDESDPSERFSKGIRLRELQRKGDLKGAKTLLAAWEAAQPDYPEVYLWKWALSGNSPTDRVAARKYMSLCQNLTPRKKKSYNLDLELCKSVEKVDEALKSASSEGDSDDDSP